MKQPTNKTGRTRTVIEATPGGVYVSAEEEIRVTARGKRKLEWKPVAGLLIHQPGWSASSPEGVTWRTGPFLASFLANIPGGVSRLFRGASR